MSTLNLCFVCLGNICRSPLAEAVFKRKAADGGMGALLRAESRGTGTWNLGKSPDHRMQACARRRGIELDGLARLFSPEDFDVFDLILPMDEARAQELEVMAPSGSRARIELFRLYDPLAGGETDVPDPYYGGSEAFESVFRMVDRTCEALVSAIQRSGAAAAPVEDVS